MTLLSSRIMLENTPTSLQNGLAAYEEDAYLGGRGYILPLDGITSAYPGYPSLTRWTSTDSLWGLEGNAQSIANQDALAFTPVLLEKHGGVAGLRRLGKAFAAQGNTLTPAKVRKAFLKGLHVSFDSVLAEAHAYAASGDWKYHRADASPTPCWRSWRHRRSAAPAPRPGRWSAHSSIPGSDTSARFRSPRHTCGR
jgi:hypothetical protein